MRNIYGALAMSDDDIYDVLADYAYYSTLWGETFASPEFANETSLIMRNAKRDVRMSRSKGMLLMHTKLNDEILRMKTPI